MADAVTMNFDLKGIGRAVSAEVAKAIRDCGENAQRESIRNAPKSPTMKKRSKTLVRRKRTRQQANPGGLERSIRLEVKDDRAVIYVAENSEARDRHSGFNYARRIHDEKGKKWWKRGAGTIAKGARADEKFIERAVFGNADKYRAKIDKAIANGLKKGVS